MKSILEIASNALLITLFVLLVYILYKRLIVFMNKKSETGCYLEVVRFEVIGNDKLSLDLSIPEEATIELHIEDANGSQVAEARKEVLAAGVHTMELSINQLHKGKYCMLLHSANSKNTRFFQIA